MAVSKETFDRVILGLKKEIESLKREIWFINHPAKFSKGDKIRIKKIYGTNIKVYTIIQIEKDEVYGYIYHLINDKTLDTFIVSDNDIDIMYELVKAKKK